MTKAEHPDKGWAWIILISGFVSCVIFDGIIYSAGIFFIEFLDYFDEGRSRTAWVGSTLSATAHLAGPLASGVVHLCGYRTGTMLGSFLAACGIFVSIYSTRIWMVIIAIGIVGGIGFSLMYMSAYVMVSYWFVKRRALATGLVSCGSGVGALILAPVSQALIESYGWRGAMWVIAGLTLNGIPIGLTYWRIPPPQEKHKAGVHRSLKSPAFVLLCASNFMCGIVYMVPFIYLPDVALSLGIAKDRGSLLVSVIGIATIVGRLAAGFLADRPWTNPMALNIVALVIAGAANVARSWMVSYAHLMVYSVILGMSLGVYVALTTIILVKLCGCSQLHTSFGIISCLRGIAVLIGPPLAGYIHDVSHNYDLAFHTAGGLLVASGLICIPLMTTDSFKCVRGTTLRPENHISTTTIASNSNEQSGNGVLCAFYAASALDQAPEVIDTYM